MEDVLKYQRIEGALQDIFTKEKVTAANLETDHIVLGTENGFLHIINFSGQLVKSARLHKRTINSISIDIDGGELSILSGADNGIAVLLALSAEDFKDSSFSFNEPLKAVCLEPSGAPSASGEQNTLSRGGERAFLVGTSAGKLILQRPSGWFRQSQKEVVLFPGAGSAVTTIQWEGNLVAWADASQVRVMDISTQTALCQMSAPMGVGPEEPYPCSLCWLSSRDLLIGWADNFRHVRISGQDGQDDGRVAAVVAEWMTDSLICGLHGFDEEHVVYLGYTPPLEDEVGDDLEDLNPDGSHPTNLPELCIANRKSGALVSADVLPLHGFNMSGPEGYMLLSSYQCKRHKGDANKWQLRSYQSQRGGARGYAPLFFVASPQDLVVARVRDVNDRVGYALVQKDLRRAVDIARVDRAALTLYSYPDLLRIYLTHLLEQHSTNSNTAGSNAVTAASECRRLLGSDALMWESWIYKFVDYKQVDSIAPLIPTDKPTLSSTVYEHVLSNLLTDHPRIFLDMVKRWGRCKPPLFNHATLLRTLETQKGDRSGATSYYIEAQAQLYIIAGMYEKAVNCYLDTRIADRIAAANTSASSTANKPDNAESTYKMDKEEASRVDYRFVFDLIERQSLFKTISNKIANLVRLSRPLSAKLLLAHIDKLSIRAVAQQLSSDKKLFLWYLHLLFGDASAREIYSDELEYGDLHARQVQLYAELMPKTATINAKNAHATSKGTKTTQFPAPLSIQDEGPPEQVLPTRTHTVDSDLLVFLKSGLAPLDLALTECEKQSPPLHHEMIYILAQMGNQRKALHLHLSEVGDVGMAIDFIESQLDNYIGNKRRYGHKLASSPHGGSSVAKLVNSGVADKGVSGAAGAGGGNDTDLSLHTSHYVECQLWDDLVDYCLTHPAYLVKVLDYLGMCKLNPVSVLSRIPQKTHIPYLKLRLIRLLEHIKFQAEVNVRSNALQEVDALNLLRQQNQGQRRAMKVDSVVRCSACSRPLSMQPGTAVIKGGQLHMQLCEMTHSSSGVVQVWGPKPVLGGASGAAAGVAGAVTTVPGANSGGAANSSANATTSAAAASEEASRQAERQLLENSNICGSVIFSNKLAFHRLCYLRMHC